jgi:HAMP domain-containing protein
MEVETAQYWLSWINRAGTVALFLVAVGVGYEFVADRLAAPLNKILDQARKEDLGRLHKETAEANEKAERERLARVAIERRLNPILLSPQQRQDAAAKLERFKGATVGMCLCPNTTKTGEHAREIAAVLALAKIDAALGEDPVCSLPNIAVYIAETRSESRELAEALIGSFAGIGLPMAPRPQPMPRFPNHPAPVGDAEAVNAPVLIAIGDRP